MSKKRHKSADHHHAPKGKLVAIELKNGEKFVDHFVQARSKYIELREHGKIQRKDLMSFRIARAKNERTKGSTGLQR